MTRVGNVDQVLLLIREQLQRSGRGRGASRAARGASAERAASGPIERMRALAMLDTLEERDLRRAVVHGLLADQLGEGVANAPELVAIIDRVIRTIEETPEGRALTDRAIGQLKEPRP
jgi:hypothetical protein